VRGYLLIETFAPGVFATCRLCLRLFFSDLRRMGSDAGGRASGTAVASLPTKDASRCSTRLACRRGAEFRVAALSPRRDGNTIQNPSPLPGERVAGEEGRVRGYLLTEAFRGPACPGRPPHSAHKLLRRSLTTGSESAASMCRELGDNPLWLRSSAFGLVARGRPWPDRGSDPSPALVPRAPSPQGRG